MAIKPAKGSVQIVDKATRPLESIAKAFNGLGRSTKKSNKEVSSFQQSLNIASSRMNMLNRSLSRGRRAARGYAVGLAKIATLGGAISGVGLVNQLNSQADALDKLAKKAGNLNLPIRDLQAMRHHADLSGVATTEMDAALTRFTKRLGVFQTTGGGLMATMAKKISPEFMQSLKGAKTNQEAYEILLKTFAKLPTQQAKMALSDAAFGQSGRQMLVMLSEGTKGLTNARKELMDLGAFATEDDVRSAEEYGDTLARIGQGINGIKIRALVPIMKEANTVLTEFLTKFKNADYRTEVIREVSETIRSLFQGLQSIAKAAKFVFNNLNEVVAVLALAKVGMFALNSVMAANPISLWISGIVALGVGLGYLYSEFRAFRDITNSIIGLIADLWKTIGGGIFDKISDFFGGGVTPTVNQQVQALAPTTNNNTANITVNVADGKVKSVQSQGNFKTNTFLNNGTQI